MARNLIIATTAVNTWPSTGTHGLIPVPHIEGLGSYAQRLSDREAILAYNNFDIITPVPTPAFELTINYPHFDYLDKYPIYYSGWHPALLLTWYVAATGLPLGRSFSLSVAFGGIDMGTMTATFVNARSYRWAMPVPAQVESSEYFVRLYAANPAQYYKITMSQFLLSWLPVAIGPSYG
jgi:hypothetical protein